MLKQPRRLVSRKAAIRKQSAVERGMDPDFIRRVCDIFGVSAEEVIGGIGEVSEDIDPVKLTELVVLSRERLGKSARR
jgi:hypothetical protein